MLYVHGAVSCRPWEPIFNVRRRPAWVQRTVFDLLRQLKVLRTAIATLPSIDTLSLPLHRQLRVTFGDLNALCDTVQFILDRYGALGVAYGGPDDRGTLWIKFYKKLAKDRTPDNQLQFLVWIDSVRLPTIAVQESISSVYERLGIKPSPLETKVASQQRGPFPQMCVTEPEALGWWREEQTPKTIPATPKAWPVEPIDPQQRPRLSRYEGGDRALEAGGNHGSRAA